MRASQSLRHLLARLAVQQLAAQQQVRVFECRFDVLDAATRVCRDVAVPSGTSPPGDSRRWVRLVGEPDPTGCPADKFGDLAVVPDSATVQHDDALAQGLDVLGLMGGQDHDQRSRDLREYGPQRDALFRIDSGGRLVQDEHRRRPEQGLRQRTRRR